MKISDITDQDLPHHADRFDVGHARPMPDTELMQTRAHDPHRRGRRRATIFGGGSHGDAEGLNVVDQQMIRRRIEDLLRRARIRSTAR